MKLESYREKNVKNSLTNSIVDRYSAKNWSADRFQSYWMKQSAKYLLFNVLTEYISNLCN